MFTGNYGTTTFSHFSQRKSTTSLSDPLDVDEMALKECIEAIESNKKDVITNKASEKEKKWWIDGNYKLIDEDRLPLILAENVTYNEFEKKCEKATASRFWEYQNGNVIITELPKRDHEVAHREFSRQFMRQDPLDTVRDVGSTTCYSAGCKGSKGSSKQAKVSLVPKDLPNPAEYPSDPEGNSWPTIICEIANTQSITNIIQKTTQFWLAPNWVEDVIILKLWPSKPGENQNGDPLHRLTCYKFCLQAGLKDKEGNYQPVQAIEFGTINSKGEEYKGCYFKKLHLEYFT